MASLNRKCFVGNDYFLEASLSQAASAALGFKDTPDVDKRVDLFAGSGSRQVKSIDASNNKYGKTESQGALSTQVTSSVRCIFTLKQTRQWKNKNINIRVSVALPHKCPVIVSTFVLKDYVSTPSNIVLFKGKVTYKRGSGGRFELLDVPISMINEWIDGRKAARAAAIANTTEPTTQRTNTYGPAF